MEGDKHFPSAELMTDECVFELSMNHSPCLLQKFLTHLYNFSSKDSPCQLLLLSGGRSRQVVMRYWVLCCSQQLAFVFSRSKMTTWIKMDLLPPFNHREGPCKSNKQTVWRQLNLCAKRLLLPSDLSCSFVLCLRPAFMTIYIVEPEPLRFPAPPLPAPTWTVSF